MTLRPDPVPTFASSPFWSAASRGELSLPRCTSCEQFYYPPPPRCPTCLSEKLAWLTLSGAASVRSWTRAFIETVPGVPPPFVIVEGELAEQSDLVLVALADADLAKDIAIGDAVHLYFHTIGHELALPEYRRPQARANRHD